MMTINLAPELSRGPLFDPDATGLMRFVPRREWWLVLPVVVVAAPVIAAVLVVDALTRREPTIA